VPLITESSPYIFNDGKDYDACQQEKWRQFTNFNERRILSGIKSQEYFGTLMMETDWPTRTLPKGSYRFEHYLGLNRTNKIIIVTVAHFDFYKITHAGGAFIDQDDTVNPRSLGGQTSL
jgi:hypothetical protein